MTKRDRFPAGCAQDFRKSGGSQAAATNSRGPYRRRRPAKSLTCIQQPPQQVPLGARPLTSISLTFHFNPPTSIVATCRMAFRDHGSPNVVKHRFVRYAQASGSPTGATYRCSSMPGRLDPQMGLRTGVWIPNRGYIQVFGFPNAATHGCLDSGGSQAAASNSRRPCGRRRRVSGNTQSHFSPPPKTWLATCSSSISSSRLSSET